MGMLDRYKKKGGFFQLLQLLETSPNAKREQFLGLIATESPVWEDALRKKILTISRVYGWDGQYLVEIFSRLPPLTLANALHGNPIEQNETLLNCLPPISKRKITDLMAESNPTPAEKTACIVKILSEIRGFISQGILKLEKVDPELIVPENFEETLNTSFFAAAPTQEGNELVFNLKPGGNSENDTGVNNGLQQEVDFLKKKLNHLTSEVNALKHENSVLKDKLIQIKRIA
ncbi:MAG: FliG C-terminal domain-containing protein [Bdellovibrio sp.]